MELNRLLFPGEHDGDPIPDWIGIAGLSNDGREITPGSLFFCHEGARFDSHTLLPALRDAGCVAAVVSRTYTGDTGGIRVIPVADTRRAEAFAASRFYGDPGDKLTLIGVTGTNGKTSVSTMIREILTDAGIKTGQIGTTGFIGAKGSETAFEQYRTGDSNTMTTPPPLTLYPLLAAMVDSGITHAVIEASSQALATSRLSPLSFACAVFTNLSPEHLDYHKTMTGYLLAKKILFRQTETAIVNGDSPWSDLLLEGLSCRRISCGTLATCDTQASDVELRGVDGVSYTVHCDKERFPVFVPIPGKFTVQNSLFAITAARTLGVGVTEAIGSLSRLRAVPGRMERIDTGDFPFSVFIDYAHTEAALRTLLQSVRAIKAPGERIVLLFGCGGDRDPGKRSEMGKTAEELADFTVVTSDNSRTEDPKKIIRAILSGMKSQERRRVIVSRGQAIRYVIRNAKPGDLILLVGKGHERYEIGAEGVKEFDEKKIVKEALEELRNGNTMEETNRADQNRNPD